MLYRHHGRKASEAAFGDGLLVFFVVKLIGDIMQRIGDHGRIQSFLTGTLISMVFGIVTFFVYVFIMAGYHGLILVVFLVESVLYVGWVTLFLKRRRELDYMRFQEASANQGNVVQLITGMQEIKLYGCEKQKRWEWERIQARKVTAIVGMSGSGKTTLIKMLLGFYQPVSGDILLDGISLGNYSPRQWRLKCGIVMQEGFIFSDTIKRNIGVIDEYSDKQRVEQAADVANIRDFIRELPMGYETKIGSDGHGLSSGQKQRILIAPSVYKNPDYMFADR